MKRKVLDFGPRRRFRLLHLPNSGAKDVFFVSRDLSPTINAKAMTEAATLDLTTSPAFAAAAIQCFLDSPDDTLTWLPGFDAPVRVLEIGVSHPLGSRECILMARFTFVSPLEILAFVAASDSPRS